MDIEFESIEHIRDFQEVALTKQIAYVAEHSPYYQRMFAEQHIDPASIRTIEDLQHLPFTEKADLQRFNDDFRCVPREDIIDYITTSGTLGDPVVFGDMAIYSMVKTNTFNGMPLPAIAIYAEDTGVRIWKTFGYEDFKQRL